jgi:chitinase
MKKKLFFLVTLIIFSVTFVFSCGENRETYGKGSTNTDEKEKPEEPIDDNAKVVVAYVTSWSTIMPDPDYLTHINYAFGSVNSTFDGVNIDNEDRLKSIVDLKKKKPSLKVVLSIGGWGSGGFSEMAMMENTRKSFAADCKRVIDQFNLDGIDMDWEHPTSSEAGIASSPKDRENFNLLMQEIRNAIGDNKYLTFASPANVMYYDLEALAGIVNYVNIMMYDTGEPPYHHSALYRSEMVKSVSADEAINNHIAGGMPAKRLTLGIPFYGHGINGTTVAYKDIPKLLEQGNIEKWDDVAKAPYLVNAAGEVTLVYDNARSIGFKCEYLLQQGLRGAMYWEYSQDDSDGTLRKAVWNGINR